jgi:hypothetical protein
MRQVTRTIAVLIVLAAAASLLYAADVTGTWKSEGEGGPSFQFTLKSEGATVTGSMLSQDGKELPIDDGKLDGDALSFSVNSEWQGQPVKLVANGKVSGDAIELTIGTADGSWSTNTTLKRAPAAAQ